MIRIGVDTGGTFTDFVFLEEDRMHTLKLPSTPKNPAAAILAGLKDHLDKPFELVHGTTVSTNAFLQQKMAKVAFVCSKGFEHLLHIGRQNRVALFSLQAEKPTAIVPLSLCFGLEERTLADGTILKKPQERDIENLCVQLKRREVQAAAILFLHAYKNPQNEKYTAEIIRRHGFGVTASHEIMPEYREYERAVVAVLNAALTPVIADYVANLQDALQGKKIYIIQSNGGVLSPERIVKEPVRTIISGPAGGVIAARRIARLTHRQDLVTIDMGGTSTDVSVIKEGELTLSREGSLEHLPLRLPMIDIATVGAGGGSIARVDRGGVLQVGPESAGADPGPACYGKSELAAVTDAFVVNGAIMPETFLGGRMTIYPERSKRAIAAVAKRIGRDLQQTAEGIIRIAVSTMERALRSVTLEKGQDPRRFTLMPFGGAGGLAAVLLAERLGIESILVPPAQGVFSALGMLVADFKKELHRPLLKMYSGAIGQELQPIFSEMSKEAAEILAQEGFAQEKMHIQAYLDMRYQGQSYELTIPYSADFVKAFHRAHQQLYSYTLADDRCEIVNLRVLAMGKTDALQMEKKALQAGEAAISGWKDVYWHGAFREFNVYRREELVPGNVLRVPAVVAAEDATVIIPAGWAAALDEYENITITKTNS